jgi:hypothetical protein
MQYQNVNEICIKMRYNSNITPITFYQNYPIKSGSQISLSPLYEQPP